VTCAHSLENASISLITHHCELVEWTSGLDVLQRLVQVLQLCVDLALGLLGALDGLGLECLNSLDLPLHVVLLWLERAELLLNVVDHVLVLEDAAVLREVDRLRLVGKHLNPAARVIVALLEVGERGGGLASEAEFGTKVGPVDLGRGRTLCCLSVEVLWGLKKASHCAVGRFVGALGPHCADNR
jgi:hypothetical protein